ncbi:MAG: glucose 1-dehydrogenase [Nocardioidaceae bacterium]|nr:MAG: glucose 1-dehydrogenase [Nocardioidaceae bacterium]
MSTLDAFRLDGHVAIVTGGGRGLGAVAAQALADAGAHVIVAGRTAAPLDEVVELITGSGGSAEAVVLDVTDVPVVQAAFASLAQAHGRLDILVNNAGVASEAPLVEAEVADWDRVVDANLRGSFVCAQAFARVPSDVERSIINIASVAAHAGVKNQAAYVASKGGVVSLTRGLAVELVPARIRVNVISPGYFATDMPAELLANPRAAEGLLRKIPQGRVGRPEEIGPAVLFLASSASSYITGAVLNIDGGFTAQ